MFNSRAILRNRLVFLLLVGVPFTTVCTSADEELTIQLKPMQRIMGPLVNYYRPLRISLAESAEEELTAEPKYASASPRYGVLKLGEGADQTITIVVDDADGTEEGIYIDRNNDEDLTNDGLGAWSGDSGSSLRLSNVEIEVPYESGTVPYTFEFYRFKTRLREFVLYYRNAAREGMLSSGDKEYKVAVLDENADGRFDDLANGTLIIDLNGDGKLVGNSDSAEHHKLDEPFNIHGRVCEVVSMSPNGTEMCLRPSDADVAMKPYLMPGYSAPLFEAKGLNEELIKLRDDESKSKYVLLDFWASWCGPCRAEFPLLRRLHAQYKNHGLRIIGVNLDSDLDRATKVTKDELLDYPHTFDGQGWKNSVATLYRVHAIPQTYLLDGDLKIVAKNLRGSSLERRLRELLGPGDSDAAAVLAARRPAPAAVVPSSGRSGVEPIESDAAPDANQDISRHFLGLALLQTARLHLVQGEFNQGKAFLSRAMQVDSTLDSLASRSLDMMHPDFPLTSLPGESYEGGPVGFSRDGRYATFRSGNSVLRQHIESGEIVRFDCESTYRIRLSPTGRYLVTCGSDSAVSLYDANTGSLIGTDFLETDESKRRRTGATPIMAFSHDEEEVALYHEGWGSDAVQFRRTENFKLAEEMPVSRSYSTILYSIVYLKDKRRLLLGKRDKVVVADRVSGESLQSFRVTGRIWGLAVSPDESLVASGGSHYVHVHDLRSEKLVVKCLACTHNVTRVRFLLDGQFLAWCSPKRASGVIESRTGRRIQDFPFGGDEMDVNPAQLRMAVGRRGVSLIRLAEMIAVGDPDPLLEPRQMKAVRTAPAFVETAREQIQERRYRIRWEMSSDSGGNAAYATDGGNVFIADHQTQDVVHASFTCRITASLAFLDGDRRLLRLGVAGNGMVGSVDLIDLETGQATSHLMHDPPSDCAISPDERFAVVTDQANRVSIFSLENLQHATVLLDRSEEDREARFSNDGNKLAIKTGESWKEYDFRRMYQEPSFAASDFGYRVEGLELMLDTRSHLPPPQVRPVVPKASKPQSPVGKPSAKVRPVPRQDKPTSEHISHWIQRLNGAERHIREEAISALSKIGLSAVPALIGALKDQDRLVRYGATKALDNIGPVANDFVPALIEMARNDDNGDARASAVLALPHISKITDDVMPVLIEALAEDEDDNVRLSACVALRRIGPDAKDAVQPIINALKTDESGDVRRCAASALDDVGPADETVVPALITALKNDNSELVRSYAVDALRNIGPVTETVVPALITALEHDGAERVRVHAVLALGKIDADARHAAQPLVEALTHDLIRSLQDNNKSVRSSAAAFLGLLGPDARAAVPILIESLNDQDVRVRTEVAQTLGLIGPDAKAAIPALVRALKDEDEYVGSRAAYALTWLGPDAKAAVPALTGVLRNDEYGGRVRSAAASALGDITPDDKALIPVLIRSLTDSDRSVRAAAVSSLGPIDPSNGEVQLSLIDALASDDYNSVRYRSTLALAKAGPNNDKVLTSLLEALKNDQDWLVRAGAAGALRRFGPSAGIVVPVLIEVLKNDENERVRSSAAYALARIGTDAERAVLALIEDALGRTVFDATAAMPALIEALRDDDEHVRCRAAVALSRTQPVAEPAVLALTETLKNDRSDRVRHTVADALGLIGPDAKSAVPVLADALDDQHYRVRLRAADALGLIGPAAKSAVPALVDALKDQDWRVHESAAEALGLIGPDAKSAVPALVDTSKNDRHWRARTKAADALRRIEPEHEGGLNARTGAVDDVMKQAALKLQTEPAGAEVLLGEADLGKTPLTCPDLRPGLYPLTVRRAGFLPYQMQVYLTEDATVDLGTVLLAKENSIITIWRVGSPLTGNVPPETVPGDLEALITELGFQVRVRSFSSEDFPREFSRAVEGVGNGEAPDVVAGNNHGPFEQLVSDKTTKSILLRTQGVWRIVDPFVFLVSRSPNHAAARYVALTNRGQNMSMSFSWSTQEPDYSDHAGKFDSETDMKALEELNRQAIAGYILGNEETLAYVSSKNMLGRRGAFRDSTPKSVIAGMRSVYVLGNSRLVFILSAASFWNDTRLGCMEILSVWVKEAGRWALLTISNDPLSLEAAKTDFPKLAGALIEGEDPPLKPATLHTPASPRDPRPEMWERYWGDFTWGPSPSDGVIAEIAEFNYEYASRLFYQLDGKLSAGMLWSTRGPWSWRIWSIGRNGRLVLSETRHFRH